MKKIYASIGFIFVLLLAGCGSALKQSDAPSSKPVLTYSNLLDATSQKEVAQQLTAALAEEDVAQFMEQVQFYNKHIPTDSLVQSGYGTSDTLVPAYDVGAISDKWAEEFPYFPGYNCRLTTFQLLQSAITVAGTAPVDDSLLFIDKEALADAPAIYQRTEAEQATFKALFGAVATENVSDTAVHAKKVQEYWRAQGVGFATGKASMVSVWFHDQLDEAATKLFIGHVGVLLPAEKGYLFIEKISFEEPYQVLEFDKKQAVYDYLMKKYDVDETGSTKPFIMENDQEWSV